MAECCRRTLQAWSLGPEAELGPIRNAIGLHFATWISRALRPLEQPRGLLASVNTRAGAPLRSRLSSAAVIVQRTSLNIP